MKNVNLCHKYWPALVGIARGVADSSGCIEETSGDCVPDWAVCAGTISGDCVPDVPDWPEFVGMTSGDWDPERFRCCKAMSSNRDEASEGSPMLLGVWNKNIIYHLQPNSFNHIKVSSQVTHWRFINRKNFLFSYLKVLMKKMFRNSFKLADKMLTKNPYICNPFL